MKETADFIYPNHLCGIQREQKKRQRLPSALVLKKICVQLKWEILSGLATLGIGLLFLLSIYLFFTQLAEYGWQLSP